MGLLDRVGEEGLVELDFMIERKRAPDPIGRGTDPSLPQKGER